MESQVPSENPITPSLIKGLASTNASIRSKNLKTLLNWLQTQTLISDDDLKRLWKSLFYCMWHCDKIQNQTHLINRLSSLLPVLPPSLSLSYFSHFITTMRREWPGIDHLRLDKFYLLVRHFVRDMFNLMKKVNWDLIILEKYVVILEKNLFFFVDDNDAVSVNVGVKGLGNGVGYHVVSVFCDEIKPFLPLSFDVLNLLFRPFFGILGGSDNRVLVAKVRSHVFDCLIKNGKGLLELKKSNGEVDAKGETMLFGSIGLCLGFSARLYELGSSDGCLQSNRKVVFSLHEEFSRMEKEKASLGVEITIPEVIAVAADVDERDVPRLIPIAGSENGGKEDANNKGKKEKGIKKNESKEEANEKKSKKKKRENKNAGESNPIGDTEMVALGDNSNVEASGDVDDVALNEDVISNLQKQFEKIAAESGLEGDGASAMDSPKARANGKVKKRKRSKSVADVDMGGKDEEAEADENTDGKSVKRVRFAMKNNLVWKPHSPLPPQSVRIPPSSTPRGSALKKGVSPGPIRDATQDGKKTKKKKKPSPLKKAKKVKSISPAAKHGKKVKPVSA